MTKYIFKYTILTFIVTIFYFSGFSQNVKEIKLNSTKKVVDRINIKQEENNPLEARLIIDSRQPVSKEGIKFAIKLLNHFNKDITIFNVLDGLSLIIYPDDPDALIPPPPGVSSRHFRGGQKWSLGDVPFKIGDVYINGQKQDIDLTQTEKLVIPKGGTYVIHLSIQGVYDKKLTKKDVFKKGRYRFLLSLGVFCWADSNSVFSDRVEVSPLIIKYGM